MADNEKTPSMAQKGWAFTMSMLKFAGSGFAQTTKEQYEERIGICDPCEFRGKGVPKNNCGECHCYIPAKAAILVATCPKKFWPQLVKPEPMGPAPVPEITERRPYVITGDGSIHGELQEVPEGWSLVTPGHWAPPWAPCRHRRVSKRYSDPPEVTPFCVLINEHVTTEICNKCEVREP